MVCSISQFCFALFFVPSSQYTIIQSVRLSIPHSNTQLIMLYPIYQMCGGPALCYVSFALCQKKISNHAYVRCVCVCVLVGSEFVCVCLFENRKLFSAYHPSAHSCVRTFCASAYVPLVLPCLCVYLDSFVSV